MLVTILQAVQSQPQTWQGLVREILTLLIQGIGALLLGILSFAAKSAYTYLKEKKKIDVNDAVKQRIDDALTKGVARAQEWGMKTFVPDPNDPTRQIPATGEMKKQQALETAIKLEPKVKELEPDVQADMIDAKLQLLRSKLSLPSQPPLAHRVTSTGGPQAFTAPFEEPTARRYNIPPLRKP